MDKVTFAIWVMFIMKAVIVGGIGWLVVDVLLHPSDWFDSWNK